MNVRGACRAGGTPPGQDRWAATDRSVIVLDGASAFDRGSPPADRYVDALLAALVEQIDTLADLVAVLSHAIAKAAAEVNAVPGVGPSSTVALIRTGAEWFDAVVLGDSTIVLGFRDGTTERLTDERMSRVATGDREAYRTRLQNGAGYDERHREILGNVQAAERDARNRDGGYWIAEADPDAGTHALTRRYPLSAVRWCVLATDGAQRGFDHSGVDWTELPQATTEVLAHRLDELHEWESEHDPDGARLPRAKRHDDKTVATWTAP